VKLSQKTAESIYRISITNFYTIIHNFAIIQAEKQRYLERKSRVFMSEIKKVDETIAAGGQPTPEDLQQLAAEGYKSVVNLRFPDETGFLSDEQQQAEVAGLKYAHIPLKSTEADDERTAKVLSELETLPTPVYFHCGLGGRANALALIAFATRNKLNREEVLAKAQELGINIEQPSLKQFLESLS